MLDRIEQLLEIERARLANPDWIPAPMHKYAQPGSGVLVVGDVHGNWDFLNRLIRITRPAMVLQCGDFGYMPNFTVTDDAGHVRTPFDPKGKIETDVPVHFCDGNHEDHKSLVQMQGARPAAHEVCKNVFYQERGSTLTLPDGRRVLFFGGGTSIDAWRRTKEVNWWPGEVITENDLDRIPTTPVDIVISHTSPASFHGWTFSRSGRQKSQDPSREILEAVLDRTKPKKWFFGHWHDARYWGAVKEKGVQFFCLDRLPRDASWLWLPHKYDRRPKRAFRTARHKHNFDPFLAMDF